MRWKKKAPLLTGKVCIRSLPVTWSSSSVGALPCPERNICPPAPSPSLPWQSPSPLSLLYRAVKHTWPKQGWIQGIKSCLWTGCGAGLKGQWVGCWSPNWAWSWCWQRCPGLAAALGSPVSPAQPRLHGRLVLWHLIAIALKTHGAISLYPTAWKLKKCDCFPAFFVTLSPRDKLDSISFQYKAIKRI